MGTFVPRTAVFFLQRRVVRMMDNIDFVGDCRNLYIMLDKFITSKPIAGLGYIYFFSVLPCGYKTVDKIKHVGSF